MEKNPLVQDVSDTAFWVAAYRGLESDRPNPLFLDPLAKRLAGAHGLKITQELGTWWTVGWSVVLRTVVIDSLIRTCIEEGIDTVLNLGAGLDTRPYRLDLPTSLVWIEADFPKLLDYKIESLRDQHPRCIVEHHKIDLADDAARRALLDAVQARSRKFVVLTEGVVPYLPESTVATLADDLRHLPACRYWIVDYFAPRVLNQRSRMKKHLQNVPFLYKPADWQNFFAAKGWDVREMRFLIEEGMRLGRMPPYPWWLRFLIRLTPEARLQEMRRMLGYALLVPGEALQSSHIR